MGKPEITTDGPARGVVKSGHASWRPLFDGPLDDVSGGKQVDDPRPDAPSPTAGTTFMLTNCRLSPHKEQLFHVETTARDRHPFATGCVDKRATKNRGRHETGSVVLND